MLKLKKLGKIEKKICSVEDPRIKENVLKKSSKKFFLSVLCFMFCFVLIGGVSADECPSSITECCEITSGGTYTMISDITDNSPSSPCIDIDASNVILHSPAENLWYSLSTVAVGALENQSQVTVRHGIFSEEELYAAEATSGLRSIYQNCYTPSGSTSCTGPNCCNDSAQSAECVYPITVL